MPKIEYNGIEFDSQEEMMFYLYLDELKDEGFVKQYTFHLESFTFSEKFAYKWL
jgi:hypothetical protein